MKPLATVGTRILSALLLSSACLAAEPNVTVWDAGSNLGDSLEAANRADWKAVPTDLFALEKEPSKAESDPGYYGREYAFKGDTVIENRSLAVAFLAAKGSVVLFAKPWGSQTSGLGRKVAEWVPILSKPGSPVVEQRHLIRNIGDEAVLEIDFASSGPDLSVLVSIGKTGSLEIKPSPGIKGFRLASPIEYGVAPSFIGDDLLFSPNNHWASDTLSVLSDNLFVSLLHGEDAVLEMTWPKGRQQLRLNLGAEHDGKRSFESAEFENDGQPFYLAALSAPGVWHREALGSGFLEKDTAAQWKPPFPARWKTQLNEAGVKTSFTFREAKGTVWRGVPGGYDYPVWFDGGVAYYHLSKKVPPKGESVVYFLEGQDTPPGIGTPVDLMKDTLGRAVADPILDVEGRTLRTHHRRGGDGVRRACTCGCTEAIQSVFEKGEEVSKKQYIHDAIGDMIYFVEHHMSRIDEYRHFADETMAFLKSQEAAKPDLKDFIASMEQFVGRIPQEYDVQKENMKSLDYAGELSNKTMALTDKIDPKNLPAYMELLKDWRGMGGAQDYVVAQCHAITRQLQQEAGYAAATQPKALELAQAIRERCRKILRNPDGYEIWPNY